MSFMARLVPLVAVLTAVILNMLSALMLKTMADNPVMTKLKLVAGITIVIAINGGRFMVWGYAHRRYALSKIYPLTSIFFPLMLLVSYLYGEVVQIQQVAGAVFITAGVLLLTLRTET